MPPGCRQTLETLFHRDLWHFAPFLALAAIIPALLGGAWRVLLYAGAFLAAGVAVVTWILWINHGVALIHDDWAIRRFVGTLVLALAVLTPLLLQRAWSSEPAVQSRVGWRPDVLLGPSRAAWVVVLAGLLSHPGSMLLGYSGSGLPGGFPRFPGDAGCARAPVAGDPVRVVVGHADTSYPEANVLAVRARAAGFGATRIAQEGCGRLRVSVDDVASPATAVIAGARDSALDLTLEDARAAP